MSHAVLYAPEFRLQAASRHQGYLPGQALALLEKIGAKTLVAEVCSSAALSGVHPGLSPAQAQARCSSLIFVDADPAREKDCQDILIQSATSLSPLVEATAPGLITLALPANKTFSSTDLEQRLHQPLRQLDLQIKIGVAPTPDLAQIVASAASRDQPVCIPDSLDSFLAPLPLDLLAPSPGLLQIFHAWGIRCIGAFLALPATDSALKLGPEALRLREKLSLTNNRPLRTVVPAETFRERLELEYSIETLDPLLFLLRRFLDQLARRLELLWLVAGKIELRLFFENKTSYRRLFALPRPTVDTEILFRMLHTHLENFSSDSAIVSLELEAWPVRSGSEEFDLFQQGFRDPQQFSETLARLEALLPPGRIGYPRLLDSHRPDQVEMLPCREKPGPLPSFSPPPSPGLSLLRFRPPLRARVEFKRGCPVFLESDPLQGPLHHVSGPWKLSGQWWDQNTWVREEWDAALENGCLCRLVREGQHWQLEGIYA